jgi:WD40 repeat protein
MSKEQQYPTPLATLRYGEGRSSWPSSVAFSPDGGLLAVGGSENTVQVLAVDSGRVLLTYRGHAGEISALAWSQDGSRVASASSDGTVQMWSVPAGEPLGTYRGHNAPVRALVREPRGDRFASAGDDGTVQVWKDCADASPLARYTGHSGPVNAACWTPSGRYLLTGGQDRALRIWEAGDPTQETLAGRDDASITALSYAPTGSFIAVGCFDGSIHLRTGLSAAAFFSFPGHTGAVISLSFSPGGQRFASCSPMDTGVYEWEAERNASRRLTYSPEVGLCVAYSPDGSRLAAALLDGTVTVWAAQGAEA